MDISVQVSMKDAAKCDNHCELQNSVNQWTFEHMLHFWVIPGSISVSLLVETMQNLVVSCVLHCNSSIVVHEANKILQ